MAGPSIFVRFLGDVTGLGKSFDQASAKGTSAAQSMHTAFSGVLNTLNQSGVLGPFGTALAAADQGISKISGHVKEIGPAMMGAGATAAGLGIALSAIGSADAEAHAQLRAAVEATGHSYDQYAGKVDAAIKTQEHFGHTADETQNALRILTSATNNPTEALKLLNTATDLAAAKHEDLSAAAQSLGRAYNGSGRALKEFGISVSATGSAQKELTNATKAAESADTSATNAKRSLAELEATDAAKKSLTTVETMKLQDAQNKANDATLKAYYAHVNLSKAQTDVKNGTSTNSKALDELSKKLSGQASAAANTFTGHLRALKAEVTDQVAQFGQHYGPAITAAGAAMTGLGATIEITKAATSALKDVQIIQTVITEGSTVATIALGVAMDALPIIAIILGIAALVAGIILAYQHCTVFRNIVDDMGRVAAAAFNAIFGAAKAVWDWISNNWELLAAILLGPFTLAIFEIVTHWNDLMTFIGGLPDKIAGIASGMWHGITEAFRHAINDLIDIWNQLHFTLPSIDFGPIHIGGETIGVPSLPHLAQGGFVTGTGYALVHAGEVVSPAPMALTPQQAAPSRSGPAVHIENVHLSKDVEVEGFLRRAAWVVRTQHI